MGSEQEAATELHRRRIVSPLSYDVIIDRIELIRHYGEDAKEVLDWDVYLYPFPDRESTWAPNYMLVGHLFRGNSGGHGQVRANALLRAYDSDGAPMSPEFVRERMAYGFIEPTYDACRRALEVQASMMDVDLDLPALSPVAEIQFDDLRETRENRTARTTQSTRAARTKAKRRAR